jgi:hypothetical protein
MMTMTEGSDWRTSACGSKFALSFSGGKDSVLALYHAMKVGEAIGLIVVMEEEGKRSRAHGIAEAIINAQAEAIGLPVFAASANLADYEKVFVQLLGRAKQHGAEVLVTGDVDMSAQDCWHDRVVRGAGLRLGLPLWEHPVFRPNTAWSRTSGVLYRQPARPRMRPMKCRNSTRSGRNAVWSTNPSNV